MNQITVKQVVYLSGKMTGLPDFGREIFNAAQKRLEAHGYRQAELAYAQNLNKEVAYYRDGFLEFVTKALKEA